MKRTPNSPKIAPEAPVAKLPRAPTTKLADEPVIAAAMYMNDHPRRAVDPLDDRPDEVQGVHVEAEVETGRSAASWTRVTVTRRQYSPAAMPALSSQRIG